MTIFRGGNGKDYLNDLHALNVDTLIWKEVQALGNNPPQRANHASSVIGNKLYIFGGWDGSKRLNDLYLLEVDKMIWTEVIPNYPISIPSPRAGMSLTNIKDKLVLFGGSGHSALCYNDLHIYDPNENRWHLVQSSMMETEENQPHPRAGHSANLYKTQLYIIGGSYGPNYLRDVSIIETDPAPDFSRKSDT